jgi:hypothetical protein
MIHSSNVLVFSMIVLPLSVFKFISVVMVEKLLRSAGVTLYSRKAKIYMTSVNPVARRSCCLVIDIPGHYCIRYAVQDILG